MASVTTQHGWAPPITVCKVGSGALAITLLGMSGGAVFGLATWLDRWSKAHEAAEIAAIRAARAAGTYHYEAPVPPPTGLYVMLGLAGLAVLGGIWWLMRRVLYAHCVSFWHPEMVAPPSTKTCENCEGSGHVECQSCKASGHVPLTLQERLRADAE